MKVTRLNYYMMQDSGVLAKGLGFNNWIYDFESASGSKTKNTLSVTP